MPRFCPQLRSMVTVVMLALIAVGCLPKELPKDSPSAAPSATSPVVNSQSPSTCRQNDPFAEAVNKALSAATQAQSAQSKEDWDLVVYKWIQAVEGMQAVPSSNPKQAFAQKKVVEYLQNLEVALSKASGASRSQFPFSTFNNPFFDQQLLLYLSYVAAVGPPDVLIVGSSRALLGIDPRAIEQALATKGNGYIKVYNFGVNGGTAQVVDLLVRQILTTEHLPRLILWADGARGFNSGRVDKTYNGMVASPGYKSLSSGTRPTFPQRKSEASLTCASVVDSSSRDASVETLHATSLHPYRWRLAQPALQTAEWESCCQPKVTFVLATANASVSDIDSNGFLPVSVRFNPASYFRQNPRIYGLYDADYQGFNLGGKQAAALNTLKAFTQSRQIPLALVNLPVTNYYLDSVRRRYEQQFRQFMQQRASQKKFVFLDLGGQWLKQNEYFADPSHLNRYGAAAISRQLAADSRIPWPRSRPYQEWNSR